MVTWLVIIGMAVVTYATRAPMLLMLRSELPAWLRRWLAFVPIAVFTALILPELLLSRTTPPALALGPALPAGIVGALVAWRSKNVLLTIVAGMLAFWALRFVGM